MIIKCPNPVPERKTKWYIFLAGPIQGAPEWQFSLPVSNKNIIWLSPRRETYSNFDYYEQVNWETNLLRICDIILFYIPEQVKQVKGRDYAQTTRTEFGEYIARGKKIIIGINKNFKGKTYIQTKCAQYGIKNVHNNLNDCVKEIEQYINDFEKNKKIFFTSDTHFGLERTLKLSKRPFNSIQDMDWNLIQNWNKVVHISDTVYHLGDFGSLWPMQYLNGKIILILGNYEKKFLEENSKAFNEYKNKFSEIYKESVIINIKDNKFILSHEPLSGLELYNKEISKDKNIFVLFGHIHGRQKIKKFGLDVGVDANNYFPLSESDVLFYKKAIDEGFYDENVFCYGNESINNINIINKKNRKIYLGGIDNAKINWKNELIKLLNKDNINIEKEENKKNECELFIYIINKEIFSEIYFFAESTEIAINQKDKCLLCILEGEGEEQFNEREKESLNKLIKLTSKYGTKCFHNLKDLANYLNNIN